MTVEEIIAELQAVLLDPGPDDAYTMEEWAAHFGLAIDATRKRIKVLARAGRIERVKVPREDVWGSPYMAKAYRVLPERD